MGNAVAHRLFRISLVPKWISSAERGCRSGVGTKAQKDKRRRTPSCPVMTLVRTPDISPEPSHCGSRNCIIIIAGARDNCNRHQAGNVSPPPPVMKLQQIICAHDPDEPDFRVARLDNPQCVDGINRTQFPFDRGRLYRASARLPLCGGEPCVQWCHAFFGLERITRRHQPPNLVQLQRIHRKKADRPVPAMRRVKRSSKQANGFQR